MKELLDKLFKDNKKRHLWTFVVIIPLLIVVGVCGYGIYKEAKNIIGTISGNENDTTIKAENIINFGGSTYFLRDNATDVQKDYFKELQDLCNGSDDSEDTNKKIAEAVVKNYVIDMYTWSNKQGQYDVSCLSYLYEYQKENIYIQIRDQYYKYINQYINKYGSENLPEVESVETQIDGQKFVFEFEDKDDGDLVTYDAYKVKARWFYKEKASNIDMSAFSTECNFVVAVRGAGKLEIVYAGENPYVKSEQNDEKE